MAGKVLYGIPPTRPLSPDAKLNEHTIKKEEYKSVSLNINTKILANCIQEHIKKMIQHNPGWFRSRDARLVQHL